ncbi:pentapeptide repeat-containing protein [Streptomyces rimosus]|uniref:pentapeptide repeat-containing protein n=1 Tax=Streptomyces rimosus TaxID=1927 RepID=UPI0037D3FF45
MGDTDRAAYLAGLAPGDDVDHRGTPFTSALLSSLLDALRDPASGTPLIGTARLGGAEFSGAAEFDRVRFCGPAEFDETQFSDTARFGGTQFGGSAGFSRARFSGPAEFDETQFSGRAWFSRARFLGPAEFGQARFSDAAWFGGTQFCGSAEFSHVRFSETVTFGEARFSGAAVFREAQFFGAAMFREVWFSSHTWFSGTQFSGNAMFSRAWFESASWFGPVACGGVLSVNGAVFQVPVTLEIAATELHCVRTRWESTVTVRLRYATADFSHAVLSGPTAIINYPARFTRRDDRDRVAMDESALSGPSSARVASIQGVDAAHLVLTDTDLADCLFSGAFHLDQLRLEGHCGFALPPTGLCRRGIWPIRWTPRRTLAEEHHWRAQSAGQPAPPPGRPPSARLWRTGPHHPDPGLTPDPQEVAALYRQLRKAFEDGKNEPGAADFYYGEMEMRRHDRHGTPPGERGLLWGYWLLSGYGLRSSRALAWLLTAMSLTVLLLMGFGLPSSTPDPVSTGTLDHGKITLRTSSPDAALSGAFGRRMTWERAEKATRVALNSVIFRSSGQNLTAAGTYIEMASRFLEPTLLALAALAIRGRIKR